jgi:hypothetical protein
VIAACVGYLGAVDRAARNRTPLGSAATVLVAVGGAITFALALVGNDAVSSSAFDAIASVLAGSSGTIIATLMTILVYVGYAFVFQLRLQREDDRWAFVTLIRYGSVARNLRGVCGAELVRIVAYIGCVGVACLLAYAVVGGRDFAITPDRLDLWVFQFVVNGVLQIELYVMVVFGAMQVFSSRLAGLAATGILTALAAIPMTPGIVVPIQLSRMSLAYTGWPTALSATGVLLAAGLVVFLLLTVLVRRISPNERRVRT